MQVCEVAANGVRGPGAQSQSEGSVSSGGQSEAGLEGGICDDLFKAALCHWWSAALGDALTLVDRTALL